MKIGTFAINTALGPVRRVGVHTPQGVVDATSARIAFLERALPKNAAERVGNAQIPPQMLDLLEAGAQGLAWVGEGVAHTLESGRETTAGGARTIYRQEEISILAPILRPPGIASFITWPAHIDDSRDKGFTMLQFPDRNGDKRANYKGNPDSVAGPNAPLLRPSYATELDVECELAAIVGRACKDVDVEQARHCIVGYSIYNDASVRDIQNREMKFGLGPTKGKDADGLNVLGPWIVTVDEVGDPHNLRMSLEVNGNELSSYSTSQMVWDHADLLSYLSRGQTLQPGHILTSGCYPGGSALDLGLTLKPGDRVALKIETLGSLENTIA